MANDNTSKPSNLYCCAGDGVAPSSSFVPVVPFEGSFLDDRTAQGLPFVPISSLSSSATSDDDILLSPPAYNSIFPPSPPLSATSTSPTESFILGRVANRKGATAPALLTPPAEPECAAAFFPEVAPASSALLAALYPAHASIHQLPVEAVELSDLLGAGWHGCVVDNPHAGTRTLYVGGGSELAAVELRESIIAVLERAEADLACSGVVLALDKKDADGELGGLVHQLLYLGCTVVSDHETTGLPNEQFLLLGMDV
ncbi:hypothetical protein Rhopal_004069-T1 [Rhodotorula paludigena]|uniref:Ornithine decarboxylase antizyme n=1 Tax=Rhodotorula paludigena TaxID=86838 RepID=A0AAV5GP76_9BASI|nr:hypothetical protein Rhopal_004069-T1 [Rhodotorula paludigena]